MKSYKLNWDPARNQLVCPSPVSRFKCWLGAVEATGRASHFVMPGVYVSFPFCAQKCSFCNFASGAFSKELEQQYNRALLMEVCGHVWQWIPNTVYFGGGTPSNMDPDALGRVLAAIPGCPMAGGVTLEAAPGTITREKAEAWRIMGINRVSLGVQSFVARN